MTQKFEDQYPGYKIIPEKKSRWKWPVIWIVTVTSLAGLPLLAFYGLSYSVPIPATIGNNSMTLPTLRILAMEQSEKENHVKAAQNFERYFILGGREADMMAMYAYTLKQLGREVEAVTWADKALKADPESKAGRMIRDALPSK